MTPSLDGAALARHLGATLEGDSRPVTRLSDPRAAGPGAAVVLGKGARLPEGAQVAVVIAEATTQVPEGVPVVRVPDARAALARLSAVFDARPPVAEGVHATAAVHPSAEVAPDAHLGPGAVVAAGAVVGAGTRVGANAVVGEGVVVGEGCILHPNVALYPGTRLGARVVLHAGAIIGADGFGYAASPAGALKIHHLGGVVLGDDVEIGANTCVDRGTLADTRVGARTKIDNLCQIGHNVTVGTDCMMAGMVAVAGSARIGNGVVIGGQAGVGDHVSIGDSARIAGGAGVTKDVPPGEAWAGFPAQPYKKFARGLYLQGRLEQLWQAFRETR